MSSLKRGRGRALLVLVFAMHFALFAVYLKSSSAPLAPVTSPVVKIWVDPDRAFNQELKIAPLLSLLLIAVIALVYGLDQARMQAHRTQSPAPTQSFLKAPNWLRPPPLF